MKRVKQALTRWSKETFGDIFQQISTLEDVIKVKEIQLEIRQSVQNRVELYKAQADLKRYLKIEEEFWKQKAGMKWFQDGDRNTKFFHSYVTSRRKKLCLHRIQSNDGVWITDKQAMGEEAVHYFQEHFKEKNIDRSYSMIQNIPAIIIEEQNNLITELPGIEEVKAAVCGLNSDSASGPDGFSGKFFQSCWDIIGEDITNMVRSFFCGQEIPRFITHTNLVLIPKKENVQNFSDLRPISLSTFANKILSRVLHERLTTILLGLISTNQTRFVKGRSIVENFLLSQEIIRDINKRNKYHNIVVKLDMAKAYDRVS